MNKPNISVSQNGAAQPLSSSAGEGNHFISLDEAVNMVNLMDSQRPLMLKPQYPPNTLAVYETYDLAAVSAILQQNTVAGFRIYLGMNNANLVTCIMIGVDNEGQDYIMRKRIDPSFIPPAGPGSLGVIIDMGQRYP